MEFSLIYMTTSNREEAKTIGKILVEKRLAACVNIIDGMTSMYWWQGKVQEDQEVVLIAKTRKTHVTKLIETVKACHGYDCPCIIELPIQSGNPAFLKWMEEETQQD